MIITEDELSWLSPREEDSDAGDGDVQQQLAKRRRHLEAQIFAKRPRPKGLDTWPKEGSAKALA